MCCTLVVLIVRGHTERWLGQWLTSNLSRYQTTCTLCVVCVGSACDRGNGRQDDHNSPTLSPHASFTEAVRRGCSATFEVCYVFSQSSYTFVHLFVKANLSYFNTIVSVEGVCQPVHVIM